MKVTAAQKCSSCSQGKTTLLWIDALCIDQTNNKERGAQVQLMDSIYQNAKEVVVWLGWWEEFNAKAANKLNARLYHITKSGQNHANFDSSGLCCMFQTTKVDTDATDEEVYDFISVICKASYWTRRWIVQEIVLAKTVLLTFGRHELPWDALCLAFDREEQRRLFRLPIPSEAPVLKSTAYQVWSHRISVKLDNNENTLFNLLRSYRSLQCSNFYDRVYSLASIATHERFKIDYSISALELFSRVLSSNHFGDSSLLDWQNIATDCGCATSEEMLNKASHPELQISRVTTRISHLVEILEVYEWGAVESAFTNILISPELCDALRTFAATVTTRNLRPVSATSSWDIDASHENSVGRDQPWPMVNPQSQSGGASCDGIDAKLISFRESSPRSAWLLGVSSSVEVGDMLCAVYQYTSLILRRIPESSEKLRVVGSAFTPGIDIRGCKMDHLFRWLHSNTAPLKPAERMLQETKLYLRSVSNDNWRRRSAGLNVDFWELLHLLRTADALADMASSVVEAAKLNALKVEDMEAEKAIMDGLSPAVVDEITTMLKEAGFLDVTASLSEAMMTNQEKLHHVNKR